MKKIILILMFSIILVSFASAQQQSLGSVKQNDCIEIIQTCPDCTYNNISRIFFPNKLTIATSNVAMTKDDTYYNYTFCNTSTLGNYIVNGYGDLGGVKTSWSYDFEVTADGFSSSDFPIQLSFIIFSFFLICIGLIKERFRLFQFTGSILMIIMGMLTLYPGYSFINWTTLTGLALGTVLLGIGFYFLIEPSFSRDEQEEYFGQGGGEDERGQ